MAALLLLLPLCSNIHAEVIRGVGGHHRFLLDEAADFCSVSRWTAEGKQLLWNSSGSYYRLQPVNVSHSGQYQEQCWTRGKVTLDRNSTLLVCDYRKTKYHGPVNLNVGETVELSCDGVGPNQSVQWAYWKHVTDGLLLIDGGTPSEHKVQLLENKSSLLITADRPSDDIFYFCLEKQQLKCHLLSHFSFGVPPEFILRSVGESLELNCSDGKQTHRWRMENSVWSGEVTVKSSLMFQPLTLDHSGVYTCFLGDSVEEHFRLFVCPEPESPAVALFSGGENLTLHCGDRSQTGRVHWFMRSYRTAGRVLYVHKFHRSDAYLSGSSLVVRNVSLQDSGQVWCVVTTGDLCVFRSETLVVFGEPEVEPNLLRSVLLSAAVLMMLCVVGVAGGLVWKGRRGEPLPVPVEELEMSQLPPESDAQEEAPV